MKIGIIGCGNISDRYIQHIHQFYSDLLDLTFVADVREDAAREKAKTYGIPRAGAVQELLEDREVELVINLTPPQFHTQINRRCIDAGKHVYTEKPFATSLEEALEITAYAKAHGVEINGAPDTYLAAPMVNCKRLLAEGWIGKPVFATANCVYHGMETWHPAPDLFYQKGAGPVLDVGGYYLSALVALLGEIESIFSYAVTGLEEREIYAGPRAGKMIQVGTPTTYQSVLRMKCGATVNLNLSFDAWKANLPRIEVYGTDGTLSVPDPNRAEGKALIFRKEQTLNQLIPDVEVVNDGGTFYPFPNREREFHGRLRGEGVASMVRAISKGEPVDNAMTIHVTEATAGILLSAERGEVYRMTTTL